MILSRPDLTVFDALSHALCNPQTRLAFKATRAVSTRASLQTFSWVSRSLTNFRREPQLLHALEWCQAYRRSGMSGRRLSQHIRLVQEHGLISSHLSWNSLETARCRNMQTVIALHVSRGIRTKADMGDELSDVVNLKNVSYDFNLLLSVHFQETCWRWPSLNIFTVDISIRTSICTLQYSGWFNQVLTICSQFLHRKCLCCSFTFFPI